MYMYTCSLVHVHSVHMKSIIIQMYTDVHVHECPHKFIFMNTYYSSDSCGWEI